MSNRATIERSPRLCILAGQSTNRLEAAQILMGSGTRVVAVRPPEPEPHDSKISASKVAAHKMASVQSSPEVALADAIVAGDIITKIPDETGKLNSWQKIPKEDVLTRLPEVFALLIANPQYVVEGGMSLRRPGRHTLAHTEVTITLSQAALRQLAEDGCAGYLRAVELYMQQDAVEALSKAGAGLLAEIFLLLKVTTHINGEPWQPESNGRNPQLLQQLNRLLTTAFTGFHPPAFPHPDLSSWPKLIDTSDRLMNDHSQQVILH
jgi:hypothetical protein